MICGPNDKSVNPNISSGLPHGWVRARLDECCEIIQGQSPPGETYNIQGIGLPFFQGAAEFGETYPKTIKWCSSPKKVAQKDDILLSIRAPVGPTNLASERCCIGRGLTAIRPLANIPPVYILYALRFLVQSLAAAGTGSTFDAIGSATIREFQVPLAPLGEQIRIISEIERQFTRLDAGVKALERTNAHLKHYRASVLKAACEGRLVPQDPNDEPAEKLLEQILIRRRLKWEDQYKAMMSAKGNELIEDKWKDRYPEPSEPNAPEPIKLPAKWVWATIQQLSWSVQYGTSAKTTDIQDGIPVLRMLNIVHGNLILNDLKTLPSTHEEFPDLILSPGDILFNRTNSQELVGKTAVYHGIPSPCSFASYLIRVRLVQGYLPDFLAYYLNSVYGRAWIANVVCQQVGQANVNGTKLQHLAIPVPPIAEQERIVAEVEHHLTSIDAYASNLQVNLQRTSLLRQSILKAAFSGRLVPQDPSDESATSLIKRIRDELSIHQVLLKDHRHRRRQGAHL